MNNLKKETENKKQPMVIFVVPLFHKNEEEENNWQTKKNWEIARGVKSQLENAIMNYGRGWISMAPFPQGNLNKKQFMNFYSEYLKNFPQTTQIAIVYGVMFDYKANIFESYINEVFPQPNKKIFSSFFDCLASIQFTYPEAIAEIFRIANNISDCDLPKEIEILIRKIDRDLLRLLEKDFHERESTLQQIVQFALDAKACNRFLDVLRETVEKGKKTLD